MVTIQENEVKGIQVGKKERNEERGKQNTLSADDMTLHRKP